MLVPRLTLVTMTVVFSLLSVQSAVAEDVAVPEGFVALFNGKDLAGWHGMKTFDIRKLDAMSEADRKAWLDKSIEDIHEHWTVEGNELVNDGHGDYLTTDKYYGDIELLIDYKTVPKADSGIYLRGVPQVQIWDSTEEAKFKLGANKGSGGLWNNRTPAGKDPLVKADKPFGEWNHFRIKQVGARTWVWLNEKLVVDGAIMDNYFARGQPLFSKGPIQLQTHGGEIRWRNVFVREIGTEEANATLTKLSGDGFEQVFNGKNLNGWKGPVANYTINDGVLTCKPHKGGTIYTEKEYSDFSARFEFKLPPGGNNGLAIRYPGSGDTAYVGMCELQILDSEHPKYAKLDKRQYHGSAYGMAAAHRGYLRPTGEWNIQLVTVVGSKITVGLNGYVILDTDLSEVTDFMANRPHPGKDRTSGHFGFAGHSDPVEFRNVYIKNLAKE